MTRYLEVLAKAAFVAVIGYLAVMIFFLAYADSPIPPTQKTELHGEVSYE
ncbi:hypothetical protein [Kiloniella antarctica]|uniref:Uncharacterized protein n=1 Tax=Kiloniella antarctica TaxID=1550907 RepID=A0ABW5BKB8_9PROT